MAEDQETGGLYAQDPIIKNFEYLKRFIEHVANLAQEHSIIDGWGIANVRSEIGRVLAERTSELVFSTAAVSDIKLSQVDLNPNESAQFVESLDSSAPADSAIYFAAFNAARSAQDQLESEIDDRDRRIRSQPIEDVALRSAAISMRLLEDLGAELDFEAMVNDLDEDTKEIVYEAEQIDLAEENNAVRQDRAMAPIMAMLAEMEKNKSS